MAVELNTLQINVDWKDTVEGAQRVSGQSLKTGADMETMGSKAEAAGRRVGKAFAEAANAAQQGAASISSAASDAGKAAEDSGDDSSKGFSLVAIGMGVYAAAATASYAIVKTIYDKMAKDAEDSSKRQVEAFKFAVKARDLALADSQQYKAASDYAGTSSFGRDDTLGAAAAQIGKDGALALQTLEGAAIFAGKGMRDMQAAWEKLTEAIKKGDQDDVYDAIRTLQQMKVVTDDVRDKIFALEKAHASSSAILAVAVQGMEKYNEVTIAQRAATTAQATTFDTTAKSVKDLYDTFISTFSEQTADNITKFSQGADELNTKLSGMKFWAAFAGAAMADLANSAAKAALEVAGVTAAILGLPGGKIGNAPTDNELHLWAAGQNNKYKTNDAFSPDRGRYEPTTYLAFSAGPGADLGNSNALGKRKDPAKGGGGGADNTIDSDFKTLKAMDEQIDALNDNWQKLGMSQQEYQDRLDRIHARTAADLIDPLNAYYLQQKLGIDKGVEYWRLAEAERGRATSRANDAIKTGTLGAIDSMIAGIKKATESASNMSKVFADIGAHATTQFADGFGSAFVDFVSGTKSAKQAFSDFARSFLSDISKMIVQKLILNAISGVVNGLLPSSSVTAGASSVFLNEFGHSGATIGSAPTMAVNPMAFIGAPRFHGGGTLGQDEVPFIGLRGERVLSRGETAAYNRGGGGTNINIGDINVGDSGESDPTTQRQVKEAFRAGVVSIVNDLRRFGGPLYQA